MRAKTPRRSCKTTARRARSLPRFADDGEKGIYGLDVDFEYVPPELREDYAAFVCRLREALNAEGKPVVAALAPKTSAQQRGLLYEAHDYALLSKAANAVFLMTYEWGYTYSEPQAIAPLPQVRAVLDYALSVTAGENIFLGAPLYAYDWPLPYEKGRTRAETFSSQAAVARARLVGAEIEFDETARSPCYHYFDKMRREHVVWFEDARSLRAKIALAAEKGLAGHRLLAGGAGARAGVAAARRAADARNPLKSAKKPPNGRQRLTKVRQKSVKVKVGAVVNGG